MKSKPIKKHHFLLLELLIAFALLTVSITPLIKIPLRLLKEELSSLYEIESYFLSERALCRCKEKLYLGSVSWASIEESYTQPLLIEQTSVEIGYSNLAKNKAQIDCILKTISIKQNQQSQKFAYVELCIFVIPHKKTYKKKKFIHKLFVCQENSAEFPPGLPHTDS